MQAFIPLIQSLLTILIPAIGTILPGVLKQNHYPAWLNSLIAGLVVLIAAVATAYTKDQIDSNFVQDAFIVGTLIAAMLAGPFKDLDAYLQAYVAIFSSAKPVAAIPTTPVVYPATIQPTANTIPGPDTSTHPSAL